jgi:hypothetical protein
LIVLDSDGNRIVSRYYSDDLKTVAAQRVYEKRLFEKTQKVNAKDEGDM